MRKALIVCVGLFLVASSAPAGAEQAPYRAFKQSSYWNKELPPNAPIDRSSRQMINWLVAHSDDSFITLAGASQTGEYGQPIYWARPGDPIYNVVGDSLPPEFDHLRIPRGAKPDSASDREMTVYDINAGYVSWLFDASFTGNTWRASGGSIHYLNSNGLDGQLRQSDEPRNRGHRGIPAPTIAVRYDEVQFGAIRHVLKIAVPETCDFVFPMVGDEGCDPPSPMVEGARIRIKRSVDLDRLGLSRHALVVARALQQYGAVIGDQSGGSVVLKLENTVAEGRGWLWKNVLTRDSLSKIRLSDYEVIKLGYGG